MFLRQVKLLDGDFSGPDQYLAAIPAVQKGLACGLDLSKAPVTFFVGENGMGKSTLLEAIAISAGFNPEGGSLGLRFSSRDTHSGLFRHIRLVREPYRPQDGYFLRAESFYNMATAIDEADDDGRLLLYSYGGKSLHQQSHGESFLSLVLHRLRGHGLYLFDEPEAALSPSRQMVLLCAIHNLVQQGSQVLMATHSPILMSYSGGVIYQLDGSGIRQVAYKDTEHYQLTLRFLLDSDGMLKRLLEDG
ncbi:MAG TPA: AAA family ATPase [Candidatus Pelethousia gallinarum]|nr:AAA family ATPase [Candidatus Pelethousia gallinarum]